MANVVITQLGPLYTLQEVKAYLRVDHGDDDTLIQTIMDSAERQVLQYCNISVVPPGAEAVFKEAAMMVVASGYDLRGTAATTIPLGAREKINPYRWLRV
jgi:uncharacterized phage protein (predicted DNA packaging)